MYGLISELFITEGIMFFSYCPENGFETHETAESARAEAQNCLDIAVQDGPIPEWFDQIRWGKILGSAAETSRRDVDPESHTETDYDYIAEVAIVDEAGD